MTLFKALLVGAGSMGRGWGENLSKHPEVEIVAWVDINPDAAVDAAGQLNLLGVHTDDDLGRALSIVKPDFVVDVSIPEAHHKVTLQSLAAGIPVLGEKPMATSMEDAREMVAASEKSGKLYMVSQSRRYDANLFAFKKLIHEQIGGLGILNSDFFLGPHFGGFREEMPSPLLLDMAIHTFDKARYLSDMNPVAVYCEEFNPSWSWYKGAACAAAIFEMENGLRYTYRGSWCSEGLPNPWQADWRAVGPKGTAIWENEGTPKAGVVTASQGFFSETETRDGDVPAEFAASIHGSLNDFLNALKTGATPMGECHDNIKSLAMVFAAIESARTGKRVAL